MKASLLDRTVGRPRRALPEDIPELNRVFADAFTDRYRRDGLVGVRVPRLNPRIWEYSLADAGEGAMLWYDERQKLAAFNIVHRSGTEGWMGPLAVRPDLQGRGLGRRVVTAGVDWLRKGGSETVGLETMPRTVDNIGFYSRLGFVPGSLTLTLVSPALRDSARPDLDHLGEMASAEKQSCLERCCARVCASVPGLDFSRELRLTDGLGLGDTTVLEEGGEVRAWVLWHSEPLAENRSDGEIRVLKVFAESVVALERVLYGVEWCALRLGVPRVSIRCQGSQVEPYRMLIERGYQVRWTDLRMTLHSHPEPGLPPGEVLFSNWEI